MANSELYLKFVRFLVKRVKVRSSDVYFLLTEEQRINVVNEVMGIRKVLGRRKNNGESW